MTKIRKFWILLLLITAVFFQAGCGGDVERSVTFYSDEAWSADISFSIPVEAVALIGSVEEIEASLDKTITEWKAEGVDASWNSSREDTILSYNIEAKGVGLNLLNKAVFDSSASITAVEGENGRQIQFSYAMGSDPFASGNNTLTLTGGDILSSNGQALNDGTAQWINAGHAEAVFTEKRRFSFGTLLLLLILIAVVGGGVWFFKQQQQLSPASQPVIACTKCGTMLAPQAQFCSNCGHKRV